MKNSIQQHQSLKSALFSIMIGIVITLAIEVSFTGASTAQLNTNSTTTQAQQH